ncbi:MAG: hypothetical protein JNL21_23375 [Myxococcales bacterium]|nr:hypothetical protein [Myxococcales bacterium]
MDKVTLANEAATGPSSGELLEQEFGKRRRGVVFAVAGVLVLLAAAGGAAVYLSQKAKAKAANEAWGELAQCLVGSEGLADDAPSLRFRRHQLAAMTLPEPERGVIEGAPWPKRCGKSALRLIDASRAAGVAGEGDASLAHQAELLAKQLEQADSFQMDLSPNIDAVFAAAKTAKLTPAPLASAPGPAAAEEKPLGLEDLSSMRPVTSRYFAFDKVAVELHQGEDRTFLVQDATIDPPAFFCTPAAAAVKCRRVPKAVPGGHTLSLLGTAEKGGVPLLFAGDRGESGVHFGDSGEVVDSLYAYGGWVAPDRTTFLLGWEKEERKLYFVSRSPTDKQAKRTELELDVDTNNYFYNTALLWNHVLVRGIDDKNERVLVAREIDVAKRKLGPEVPIGTLPEPGLITSDNALRPHISGCRSKDYRVVRVKGRRNDFLAFYVDGKWTKPHSGQFFDGRLTCSSLGAALTFISKSGVVTETRCTSASCTTTSADLVDKRPHLAPRNELYDVVTVADKVVAVWAAGERGGIRVRVAPAAELDKARDVVVYDDLVYDGKAQTVSSVSDVGLVAGDDHAVLLLGSRSGVFAFRVGLDGSVTPSAVEWATGD